jgi:hypothetical protein
MSWKQDPEVMVAIHNYVNNQKDDLSELLNHLFKHNDNTPPFMFFQVFGKFVFTYSELSKTHTESDAFDLSIAEVISDPVVQNLVASMVGQKIDRGLGL